MLTLVDRQRTTFVNIMESDEEGGRRKKEEKEERRRKEEGEGGGRREEGGRRRNDVDDIDGDDIRRYIIRHTGEIKRRRVSIV